MHILDSGCEFSSSLKKKRKEKGQGLVHHTFVYSTSLKCLYKLALKRRWSLLSRPLDPPHYISIGQNYRGINQDDLVASQVKRPFLVSTRSLSHWVWNSHTILRAWSWIFTPNLLLDYLNTTELYMRARIYKLRTLNVVG